MYLLKDIRYKRDIICFVYRFNIIRGWDVYGEEEGIIAVEAVSC